ncbi:MAG: hypothetical protein K0R38_332 [Polyangiaceae bacterium]|nr:hypothetical protein [Polyangiaceae bacterium]
MSTRAERVVVARRFCGPPDSGNGGYSAGLLATALGGAVEVTLRRPPPLERELSRVVSGTRAELKDGEGLIAEARHAEVNVMPPPAVSFERASELSTHYIGHTKHHFPGCFVCGPARAEGDGLRIFPGHEQRDQPMAAPWTPDASLADESGRLPTEIFWAALDCIGYFAAGAPDYPVALLGRMTAELGGEIAVGERYVLLGWPLAREGRKLHAGTALYDASGNVRGRARQTWILLA